MAKYAPIYMTIYDGAEYALVDLALSAATFVNGAAAGTDIGTLSGMSDTDSTLSIVETDNRFQLNVDGVTLEVGSAGTALAAGTYPVTIRETNSWADPSFHDTAFEITVT